jgi:hypothetical protein
MGGREKVCESKFYGPCLRGLDTRKKKQTQSYDKKKDQKPCSQFHDSPPFNRVFE